MTKASRARYTLEFKQEAVRLVENGQSIAAAARTLGVVDQTLFNWVKAHRGGCFERFARQHAWILRSRQVPGCINFASMERAPSLLLVRT